MTDINDNEYKEVYFHMYCKECKHRELNENQEPCNECLGEPINQYSHKPIKFEKKEK